MCCRCALGRLGCISIKEVDVGLAADTGMLVCMPKLAAKASFVHEPALSVWVFNAEEALWSLSFTVILSLLNYSKRVLMT